LAICDCGRTYPLPGLSFAGIVHICHIVPVIAQGQALV